ncbi:MAG: type II toxin-antitoxin system VapC family toxin [Schlesneria sp.]
MKLVIDASIGIKAILPEQDSAQALQLRDDFRKGIHQLFAPDLYFLEVGNVLVMAARAGKFPVADLPFTYSELIRHQPIICPSTSLFPRAFAIASQIRVSLYDATYLALSEEEGCPLLTNDQKLINAAKGFSFISLNDL